MHPSDDDNGGRMGEFKAVMDQCNTVSDGGVTPLDRVLEGLADPRRRYLLYYLNERESCGIDEAAQYVAACERECDLEEVPAKATERVKINLFHAHLPKLDEYNLVEYDQRSKEMRYRDPPDSLSEFLKLAKDMDTIDPPEIDE